MEATLARPAASFAELAAILARGYLRWAEKRRQRAVSRACESRKSLDSPAHPSPPVPEAR